MNIGSSNQRRVDWVGLGFPRRTAVRERWTQQCEAAHTIRKRFGLHGALSYLVGEKLIAFLGHSQRDPWFNEQLPDFLEEIHRMFTPRELKGYIADLPRRQRAQLRSAGLGRSR